MIQTKTYQNDRIVSLISGNFSRKEFRHLTIDQMLELGRLTEEEGMWHPGKSYYSLDNDDKFELMFDPKYNFHKVIERIDIFVSRNGDLFVSERSN
jgi:hypothetical protein